MHCASHYYLPTIDFVRAMTKSSNCMHDGLTFESRSLLTNDLTCIGWTQSIKPCIKPKVMWIDDAMRIVDG
jgi:hypothetical protein